MNRRFHPYSLDLLFVHLGKLQMQRSDASIVGIVRRLFALFSPDIQILTISKIPHFLLRGSCATTVAALLHLKIDVSAGS